MNRSLQFALGLAFVSLIWLLAVRVHIGKAGMLEIVTVAGEPVCHATIISTPSERAELKEKGAGGRCYLLLYEQPVKERLEWLESAPFPVLYLDSNLKVGSNLRAFKAVLLLEKGRVPLVDDTRLQFLGLIPRAIDEKPETIEHTPMAP